MSQKICGLEMSLLTSSLTILFKRTFYLFKNAKTGVFTLSVVWHDPVQAAGGQITC